MPAVRFKTPRGEDYRREHLVNVPALITMAIVIALTLILLFPKQAVFSDPAYVRSPDALSIAYLKLLLTSDPDNTELRFSLARQLYITGQIKLAMSVINPLVASAPTGWGTRIYNLNLKLIARQYFVQKGKARKILFSDLRTAFIQAINATTTFSELKTLYHMAQYWVTPDEQMILIKKIISLAMQPQQKVRWMIRASDLSLAKNQPEAAAKWLEQAYTVSNSSTNKPKLATRVLETLLATGKPDKALQKTPYYVHRHPHSHNLLQLAISIAQQTGRTDLVNLWLTTATRIEPDNMDYNQRLMKLKIATGQLKSAAHLADVRLQHPHLSIAERTRIARLYEWTAQPDKALKQWNWLTMHSEHPSKEAQQRALKLAIGLFHYQQATRLYEHIARQRPLTLAEQKELTGLYLIQGQTGKVKTTYLKYLKQHPQSKEIWDALAGLYVSLQQLPLAATTYEHIDKHVGLTDKQLLDLKNIYRLLGEPGKAQALLLSHRVTKAANENAYWVARTNMAWFLEDTEQLDDIYGFLLSRDKKQPITLSMLDQLMILYDNTRDYKKSTRLAMLGWQRSHQPRYAIHSLHYASQYAGETGQWTYALKIAGLIQNEPLPATLKRNSQYWQLLATIARKTQQWPQAIHDMQQAVLLSPDNAELEQSLLWLLIERHREKSPQLKTALLSSIARFGQNPYLLDAQASGWAALGQYDIAARWYRQSLPKHQQDWPWLLDYAYALQQSGQTLAAWRVRHYTLVWMQQHPQAAEKHTGRDWKTSYLRLIREFYGSAIGWKMAEKLTPNLSTMLADNTQTQQDWLALLNEWSLADNNLSLSTRVQAQAHDLSVTLPAWQRLGLALQQHDNTTIETLLNSDLPLPLTDKTQALAENGYHGRALAFGLSHLSPELSLAEQQQLRAITASMRSEQPNGIKLGLYNEVLDDISMFGPQLRYAIASDQGVTLIDAKTLTTTGEKSLVSQWPDEKNVRLTYIRFTHTATQRWHLGVDQRVNGNQPEFGFSQSFPVYANMAFQLSVGLQQRSRISGSAYELVNWNHIDIGNNYQLDSRTGISSQVRWNRYNSVWGDFLGQGFDIDMNLNHTLFVHAPEWQIYSNIQWTRVNAVDKLPADFQPYFTAPNPDINSVLTERFGRIGIGTSLQHGIPGKLAHQVASPHWLLNLNGGFQWSSGRFDWGAASGFGWRIFGDDELALTARYDSDARGAGRTYKVWLGYNKYFGR